MLDQLYNYSEFSLQMIYKLGFIKRGLLAHEKNDMSRPEIVTTGGEWVNKKVISRTKSDKYLPASKLS